MYVYIYTCMYIYVGRARMYGSYMYTLMYVYTYIIDYWRICYIEYTNKYLNIYICRAC